VFVVFMFGPDEDSYEHHGCDEYDKARQEQETYWEDTSQDYCSEVHNHYSS
jgi:hypothetical protein